MSLSAIFRRPLPAPARPVVVEVTNHFVRRPVAGGGHEFVRECWVRLPSGVVELRPVRKLVAA